MILMRPGEGHLEACPMPALNKQFTTYTLTPIRLRRSGCRMEGCTFLVILSAAKDLLPLQTHAVVQSPRDPSLAR